MERGNAPCLAELDPGRDMASVLASSSEVYPEDDASPRSPSAP